MSDWRLALQTGLIGERLAATLALLEHVSGGDISRLEGAVAQARRAGVPTRALVGAGYVNFGFNIINRVADGLGVSMPEAPNLQAAAALLLRVGYRPLSGLGSVRRTRIGNQVDPFQPLVDELRAGILRGPAMLTASHREALYHASADGPLGNFGRAVADRASTITRDDIDALGRHGCHEDEVFEAAICAALGAATGRLESLLAILV